MKSRDDNILICRLDFLFTVSAEQKGEDELIIIAGQMKTTQGVPARWDKVTNWRLL